MMPHRNRLSALARMAAAAAAGDRLAPAGVALEVGGEEREAIAGISTRGL
jgi:hypothetical protein